MEPQVLIVGAGPTGLILALWLARRGVPFRIIDKNTGPGLASRAMVVQARTLEFYRQLGIADQVVHAGILLKGICLRRGTRAIAGFQFGDFGPDFSPFPYVLSFPQDDHERFLVNELHAAGISIEWNTELTEFTDDGRSVKAILKKGDARETAEFRYLCGCDGAHSTVRQFLKLGFPGGTYQQLFYVADVQATGLPINEEVSISLSSGTFVLAFPVRSTRALRLIGVVPREVGGKEHLEFEDIRPFVKRQMGVDVTAVNWFSIYHVHHRVSDHFRRGRVFVAGDAGHIHSPAGGQGMNTGIGDAVNLAWKLSAVLKGQTHEKVLETYETERLAFARSLVKTTDRLFQGLVGRGPIPFLIRSVLFPYVLPVALRFAAVRRAQFRLVSQTLIHYPKSPLSAGSAGAIRHGERLPWLHKQDNYAPLKSLNWQIHIYGAATAEAQTCAEGNSIPIHVFEWDKAAKAAGFARDGLYLVRPDGYIAYADKNQNIAELARFIADWQIKQ